LQGSFVKEDAVNVSYTGRQQEVTPFVRKQVETRLTKLSKILGPRPTLETHVILAQERHLTLVEITVNLNDHAIVGAAGKRTLRESLTAALEHLEKQVLKQKARWRVTHRHARPQAARSIRTLRAVEAA
jgi:ribosomal subunit interface protein